MNHQPRKRFGQHFLADQNLILRLIRTIDPRDGERLVEIGPGEGALTYPLLEYTNHLHVVELDRDLVVRLRARIPADQLTVHACDALKFDFGQLADGPHSLRVVGNLPYNISTPIIFHLLAQAHLIRDMHFMLQKEVVDRMVAVPGNGDWGRLSIMVQYHCQAEYLMFVPPGAFRPPPKVDSAIVRLTPHETLPVIADDYALFKRLVTAVFTQKRKTLRNGLKSFLSVDDIRAVGVDPGERPERLSLADFVALANLAAKTIQTGTGAD